MPRGEKATALAFTVPDGRWGGGGEGAWAAGVRAVVQYGMDAAALSVAGAGDVADGSVIANLLLLCAVRPCRPQSVLRGTPIDPSGLGAAPTYVCWCCGVVGGGGSEDRGGVLAVGFCWGVIIKYNTPKMR